MEIATVIPKVIHFIFGLKKNSYIPFSCYHYLAVATAKAVNKDCEIVIHYYYEPQNEWWELCKPLVKLDKLAAIPTDVQGNPIAHHAHLTDHMRVEILLADGGIYLDMDTICIRPFEPLLIHRCVMGLEMCDGQITGLCNGVIMAEPDHVFLRLWKDAFKQFDANDWNKLACRIPMEIFNKNTSRVYLEPPESFFRLTWADRDLRTMHEDAIEFNLSYSAHLWETAAYKKYLSKVTLEDVKTRDCTFNRLIRRNLGW